MLSATHTRKGGRESGQERKKNKALILCSYEVCDVEDASMHTSAADVCTLPAKENRMRSTAKGGGRACLDWGVEDTSFLGVTPGLLLKAPGRRQLRHSR